MIGEILFRIVQSWSALQPIYILQAFCNAHTNQMSQPLQSQQKETQNNASPRVYTQDQEQQIIITTPPEILQETPNQNGNVTRQLTENPQNSRQNLLSGGMQEQPLLEEDMASIDINPLMLDRGGRNDQRNMTQGGGPLSRQSSPNKQSVLVKRVLRDGRVVSGLDSLRGKRNSEPIDEDIGTLGSQNGEAGQLLQKTQARESKAVNCATQEAADSRMRSTMYITGKSQRFPLKANQLRVNPGLNGAANPNSMVINLGDRTESNFGNIMNQQSVPEVDMVIGVTDIMTGKSRIQNTTNFALIQPPPALLNQTNSMSYRSSDYNRSNSPAVHAAGTQAAGSQLQMPLVIDIDEAERLRVSAALDSQGMQIQSLSPTVLKTRNKFFAQHNANLRSGQTSESLLLQNHGARVSADSPPKQYQKTELTGISVTIVDARSMIPQQPAREPFNGKDRSPRLPAKLGGKNVSKSPSYKNDIKKFHKATAQQYKEFIKRSQQEDLRKNFSSRMENHDNSQSTLMDHELYAEKVDNSLELRPGLINQGTQPSEIMMHSLEDQLQQLKNSSAENFYTPNTAGYARIMENMETAQEKNEISNVKLLDTIRSEVSTDKKMDTQQMSLQHQTIQTLRQYENDSHSNITNSRMLQTYRGSDNMKLKIIDQSVLRTQGANNTSQKTVAGGEELKSQQSRVGVNPRDSTEMVGKTIRPKRKSIIFDSTSLIDHRQHSMQGIALTSQYLSPYESSVMQKASPLSRIESFRALLHQESAANELRIINNQDNFKNLINPEVTRKDYNILSTSPSRATLNMSNVQNQQLLMRKEDMLHTVTNEFLEENLEKRTYSQKQSPPRTQRIAMDVNEFRAQLARKIEQIRLTETGLDASQVLPNTADLSSQGSVPFGAQKCLIGIQESRDSNEMAADNTLFMTFLQHSQKHQQVDFTLDEPPLKKALKSKRPPPLSNRQSTDMRKEPLELPLLSPQQRGSRRERTDESSQETQKQVTIDPMSEKASKQKVRPFKGEHDLVSFAEQNRSARAHQKSGTTLASSGSSKTLKRITKRYVRDHRIAIFEDGCEMSSSSPCLVIELNSLLRRHYLQQNGSSTYTTQQEDINAQITMYQRAVREVLDQCGTHLSIATELTPEQKVELKGAAPKRFTQLYTAFGEVLTSLLQIDEDCCILIAGDKSGFKGLKTSTLFQHHETANNMLNRIVDQSPITFDTKSNFQLGASLSSKKRESPFKRQRTNDSPSKTFALTQSSVIDGVQSPSKATISQPLFKDMHEKRYQSLTSRDIIKASKAELMRQLTSKKSRSQVSSNTLQAKRMASLKIVTKGIKRGKLPPIKTPKQLEVFVFGEKKSNQVNTAINVSSVITSPKFVDKSPIHRTMTIAETANEGSMEQDTYSIVQTDISGMDMRKKRATQEQIMNRQQYADSIKQESISSIPPRSSMGVSQSPEIDFELSEQGKAKKVNLSLRRKLDNVHSIQMIEEDQNASIGTFKTEKVQPYKPNARISAQNIKVARVAIRERSPSYSNNKLVSQTSLQEESQHTKIKMKLTQRQKDKLKAEANEHVLQNALKQRENWRIEHKLDDRQLFSLFSEFSTMMQIHRMQTNEEEPDSLRNKMKIKNSKTGENDDKMQKLFPMGAKVSSTKYNLMQQSEKHKHYKLQVNDYRDFRVPVQVCVDYAEVLRPTKVRLRAIVMSALGVLASSSKTRVTMDQFLHINSFLRFGNHSADDFVWFCVKLFDPQLSGFTRVTDCEEVIDLLFDNQDEDGKTTKAPEVKLPNQQPGQKTVDDQSQAQNSQSAAIDEEKDPAEEKSGDAEQNKHEEEKAAASENAKDDKSNVSNADETSMRAKTVQVAEGEGKDESVSANIKKVCYEKGIFKADGFLQPNLLYEAFKDGQLDIEDFKSALR